MLIVLSREHQASEVYVTGAFDEWRGSVKLDKKDDGLFEKTVELLETDEKIYYKVCCNCTISRDAAMQEPNFTIYTHTPLPCYSSVVVVWLPVTGRIARPCAQKQSCFNAPVA